MTLARRWGVIGLLSAGAACGGGRPAPAPAPSAGASPRAIDSLWTVAVGAFGQGKWGDAQREFERVQAALPLNDPRYTQLHFFLGEIHFARVNQLQAVREFRRVSDERPDDPLAPEALLRAADAYADLWRRPELDPTYGETARNVYREVVARYPGTPAAARATARLADLAERFAVKEYRNALFYFRYKAYDSAILLLRSLLAEHPRAKIAPEALEKLVRAYQLLGYAEDVKETCAYIAEYHPDPAGPHRLCPKQVVDSTRAPPPSRR